ncbi:MAG TPA: biopolymer transporter ExbD [Gemmatales bacterium]|nr:biopolymer transporter ExbD [Gemmatales bacterium]
MAWRLRHEGSPQPVAQPLTSEQIVEGLKDGVYATSDEVRGPKDAKWITLESHPHFAEVAEVIQAIEEEAGHEAEDNNIDMNPLIDVCLVLLVFFILATTMSVMEKMMRLPPNAPQDAKPKEVKESDAKQYIILKIEKKGAGTNFNVNGYDFPGNDAETESKLLRELERLVKEGKSTMILDLAPNVEFNAYTLSVDVATQAQIKTILTKSVVKGGNKSAPPNKTAPPAK